MPNPNELRALIERVEAATGPDDDLDRDIDLFVADLWVAGKVAKCIRGLPYTSDLKPALTLVPDGHGYSVRRNCSSDGEEICCNAQVWGFRDPRDDRVPTHWATSPVDWPEKAVVLAALRASLALMEKDDA